MEQDLLEQVRRFVAKERGVPISEVGPATTLLGDLGTDGDDAVDFFDAFGRAFDVDLSELNLDLHFGPESSPPWALIYWLVLAFRRGTPEQKVGLSPITVADLASAASSKRWTPIPQPSPA